MARFGVDAPHAPVGSGTGLVPRGLARCVAHHSVPMTAAEVEARLRTPPHASHLRACTAQRERASAIGGSLKRAADQFTDLLHVDLETALFR